MYLENKFGVEEWEVSKDFWEDDEMTTDTFTLSIVNDYMRLPTDMWDEKKQRFFYEDEPLDYWVEMEGVGPVGNTMYHQDYEGAKSYILDNYYNCKKKESYIREED